MPQDLLRRHDVSATHDEVGSEGVAQDLARLAFGRELEVLHWQGKTWLPLNECARLLEQAPWLIG
ncbi:hypothetical protein D3C77_780210 [compost metagenome]